jgi:solute carrier family 25 2-oxodicarboxylate transporter 21
MAKQQSAFATLPPVTCAAVVTSITMYPADVIRAICMSNPGTGPISAVQGFVGQHGLKGFVQQGLAAEITRASFSRVIKFWLQPVAHQSLFGKPETKGTPVSKGAAGAFATIPEVIIISPLENAKLAEQLDTAKRFNGMMDVFSHIMKTRGVAGLYTGYIGMQIRQCMWTGGFFLSLDVFKGVASNVTSNKLGQDVLGGFFAGAFGTCLNCWTDVCRSVIQKNAIEATFNPSAPIPSAFDMVLNPVPFFSQAGKIFAEKGIGGLYSGFGIKCVHLGGSGAILAVLMPRFKSMFGVS